LANYRLNQENALPGAGATSLVHDVYLRLVGPENDTKFVNHRHFFASAAEAMRRILIERARKRATIKHGGGRKKLNLDLLVLGNPNQIQGAEEILALNDAIEELQQHHQQAAELVKLRFFAGFSHTESAEVLGITRRQADGLWIVAKTWLYQRLSE
jgi:RNA polymerase sigma factor (TIGR02999 family)